MLSTKNCHLVQVVLKVLFIKVQVYNILKTEDLAFA